MREVGDGIVVIVLNNMPGPATCTLQRLSKDAMCTCLSCADQNSHGHYKININKILKILETLLHGAQTNYD